jgi:hypothetical protein
MNIATSKINLVLVISVLLFRQRNMRSKQQKPLGNLKQTE